MENHSAHMKHMPPCPAYGSSQVGSMPNAMCTTPCRALQCRGPLGLQEGLTRRRGRQHMEGSPGTSGSLLTILPSTHSLPLEGLLADLLSPRVCCGGLLHSALGPLLLPVSFSLDQDTTLTAHLRPETHREMKVLLLHPAQHPLPSWRPFPHAIIYPPLLLPTASSETVIFLLPHPPLSEPHSPVPITKPNQGTVWSCICSCPAF